MTAILRKKTKTVYIARCRWVCATDADGNDIIPFGLLWERDDLNDALIIIEEQAAKTYMLGDETRRYHVWVEEVTRYDDGTEVSVTVREYNRPAPESYGTIWVCVDCMLHHANGECGDCHREEGHDEEPLSAIGEGFHVAMGMAYEEHSEDCARRPLECTECTNPATHAVWWQDSDGTRQGEPRCGEFECMGPPADAVAGGTAPIPTPFPVPDNYECDCETDTFSRSQCEGCGSYLHGERHAMTLFKGA